MKKEVHSYYQSLLILLDSFVDKYYDWADYDIIGNLNIWLWPIEVCDDYRDIDKIVTALNNNIPKKILTQWYSIHLDAVVKGNTCINLYNYRKQNA